jgi:hypothetical protein
MKKDTEKKEGTIFTVDDNEFGWEEIVLAADAWGEWKPFFEQTRQSLACLHHAAKTSKLPSAAEMREVANAFRYAHNLISAEDTNVWLAHWQMTIEDWMNYLRCHLLSNGCAGRRREIIASNPVSDQAVTAIIKSHAVCSDKLRDWSIKLAGRAAIAASSGLFDGAPALASIHNLIERIETEFEQRRQQTVTPKLIETRIADHHLDWIRFDCRYVWFPEKQIAREAAWCVSEDGLSLDEVAYNARGIVQHWNFYLDEIEAPVRPRFLAARTGDWLGPIKMLEGFPLFSIVAKTMPVATDPQIRERAEQAILTSFTQQAINERVRWATLS